MFFLADGHCDTLTKAFDAKEGLFDCRAHVNIQKLNRFESPLQSFAIWLSSDEGRFLHRTLELIDFFYQEMEKNRKWIMPIRTSSDILSAKKHNKISAVLAIEGGEALEGNLANVRIFYRLGVRAIGLTWNHANDLGDGVMAAEGAGLTSFGQEVVTEMNRLGMAVDVSHLSEKGFWDVYRISEIPFMASHSNCRSICGHPRNLTDGQLRAVRERKGFVGMNLFPPFLSDRPTATIEDVLCHIDKALSCAGEDCVGLGCDFDGISSTPEEMDDITSLGRLYNRLEKVYGKTLTEKIAGGNLLQFFQRVLPCAE